MAAVDRNLRRILKSRGINLRCEDDDTLVLDGVPANPRYFNKGYTNLLLKRPAAREPFLIGFDADLEYHGPDRDLRMAFAASPKRDGWRVVLGGDRHAGDIQSAVHSAMQALGSDDTEPRMPGGLAPEPLGENALACGCIDLTEAGATEGRPHAVARDIEVEDCLACLLGRTPRLPVLVGEPGAGKTAVLHAVARRLKSLRPEARVIAVDLGYAFRSTILEPNRESALDNLLDELMKLPEPVLAIEDLDRLPLETAHGAAILRRYMANGLRILGTAMPAYRPRLSASGLAADLQYIRLIEPEPDEAVAMLEAHCRQADAHPDVEVDPLCANACVGASADLPGWLPGKAVALLDAVVARAAMKGNRAVGPEDVHFMARRLYRYQDEPEL